VGHQRVLQTLAARKAFSEQSSPFGCHFLVDTVEQEDEESLEWGSNGEENEEDRDDNVFWDEEHKISEDP